LHYEEARHSTTVNNLSQTIDDYLIDCRGRGLSLKTVEDNYGYSLKEVFLPWALAAGLVKVTDIDDRTILRWQAHLLEVPGRRGKLVSRYSIKGWITSVNTFLRWARDQGEMDHEARGRAPKPERVLLEVLSREQIDRMEMTAKTERDKLIVRLFADTGIRASELLKLRTSDLIERDRQQHLRIRGKGSKQRLVPIPRLAGRLKRFIHGRSEQDAERLFLGLYRRPGGSHEPLTLSGLQKMVRSLGREAGITTRVYPHLLRHSYATWALSKGMSPIQLADILGHSSLVMIQRNYAHLSNRDAYDSMVRLLSGDE
jgi:integrase